jgi:hypothetical protein
VNDFGQSASHDLGQLCGLALVDIIVCLLGAWPYWKRSVQIDKLKSNRDHLIAEAVKLRDRWESPQGVMLPYEQHVRTILRQRLRAHEAWNRVEEYRQTIENLEKEQEEYRHSIVWFICVLVVIALLSAAKHAIA